MLDKISIISSKIKRNCLSLVIASVIISIIFGKSIAREVEFLLVIGIYDNEYLNTHKNSY